MTTFAVHIPSGSPCTVVEQEYHPSCPVTKIAVGYRKMDVPSDTVSITMFVGINGEKCNCVPSVEFKKWQDGRSKAA